MKNHLKRLFAPKSWNILRKERKFVARPNPGAHSFEHGIPLIVLLRDMLNKTGTSKETKFTLTKYGINVDAKKRNDSKMIVGLMDVVSIPSSKENYRVVINENGKIDAISINDAEAKTKLCKIVGKKMNGKKFQITTHDGRTILTDTKDYNTGDTLSIELPSQKITEHLKLEPKMTVYLVGGKHAGSVGSIENVAQKKITYKAKSGEVFETLKEYAFVVGKTKPSIKITNEKN